MVLLKVVLYEAVLLLFNPPMNEANYCNLVIKQDADLCELPGKRGKQLISFVAQST